MSSEYMHEQKRESDQEAAGTHQSKKRFQATGIPDGMRQRFEAMSGFSYGDVRVRYNSDEPAKLDASAFTRGNEVHIGPGQDRYLEHELGHVAQQKQGIVRPTGEIGGTSVNENPALERQADSMLSGFHSAPLSEGGASLGSGQYSANAPVQMAGHAGVMVFSSDGKLTKRVEKNEYEEFVNVWQLQQAYKSNPQGASREERMAVKVFPEVYMAFGGQMPYMGSLTGKYTQKKFDRWAKKHKDNEDYYVEMENLSGSGLDIMDFKVGTASTSYMDLTRHHGKSHIAANKKVEKMTNRDDRLTETSKYGLRDSDATQNGLKAAGRSLGRFHATLDSLSEKLEARIGKDENNAYKTTDPLIHDLEVIEDFIKNSDTVYVASSVILSWDKERKGRWARVGSTRRERAKLIDLAHPIRKDERGFEDEFPKIQAGMALGVRNLRNKLLNRPMEKKLREGGDPALRISDPKGATHNETTVRRRDFKEKQATFLSEGQSAYKNSAWYQEYQNSVHWYTSDKRKELLRDRSEKNYVKDTQALVNKQTENDLFLNSKQYQKYKKKVHWWTSKKKEKELYKKARRSYKASLGTDPMEWGTLDADILRETPQPGEDSFDDEWLYSREQ